MSTQTFRRFVRSRGLKRGSIAVAVAVLLTLPLVLNDYLTSVLIEALVFGLFAVSVNIALGYGGLLTLAPAAFFGIGAYSVAKTVVDFQQSFWIGLAGGVVLAAALAVFIGYVPIKQRIEGVYFALFTMAFGVIVHDFVYTATDITGGSNGLGYVPAFTLFGINFSRSFNYYYFVFVTLFVVLGLLLYLLKSDYGTILHGIRQNDQRMRYLGYDTDRELMIAWILSCSLSALAGGLYVGSIGLAAPELVAFALTGEVLIWVVVGGIGTFFGPFVAAFGLVVLETLLGSVWTEGYLLVLGVLFVIFVFVFPHGIMGFVERLK